MIRERADDRAWHHAIFDRLNIRRTCTEDRPARRRRRRRPAAVLAGMGLLHPLPMGRVRHGPVRTGTLLGPAARAALADRRPAAAHRPRRSARWTTSTPRSTTTSTAFPTISSSPRPRTFSTDIDYRLVSDAEMDAALAPPRPGRPGRARHLRLVHQRGLPDGPGEARRTRSSSSSAWAPSRCPTRRPAACSQRTIAQLAEMIGRHPRLRFQCFLSSRARQPVALHAGPRAAQPEPGRLLVAQLLPRHHPPGHGRAAGHAAGQQAGRLLLRRLLRGVGLRQGVHGAEADGRVLAEKIDQGQYTRDEPWRSPGASCTNRPRPCWE